MPIIFRPAEPRDHASNRRLVDDASWLCKSKLRRTYGPDLELDGADYAPKSSESVIRYAIPVSGGAARRG